ncbi:MAG: kinase-like domain-containing protein, partial [Linnemannia gamsii]
MRLCGNHDNIVQFYGVANKHHSDHRIERFMIMQFYDHGDLFKLIHLPRSAPESPSTRERMLLGLDIATGLEYLTRCGFHHGDLHPKNVLIDTRRSTLTGGAHAGGHAPRYQARLTDFGLRRLRGSSAAQSSQPLGGVWQFMAPERLTNRGISRPRYDIRCDIFALGVIYWFILAGRYPFKDYSMNF